MPDNKYPGPETIHRHVLANGITVLVYENFASQSVIVGGLVRAGALAESADRAGLAGFVASLLMRGTEARAFEQVYEDLEAAGAGLEFGSGRHSTDFAAYSLVEDLDLVLDLLAQSLRHPTFPAVHVEQMRGHIMTGLEIRANDTRRMASLRFHETLYQSHPYGRSSYGYNETISSITRDDIATFHSNYYGPRGMIITIVGAIKAEEALAKVEARFGDWSSTAQKALPPVPPAPRPEKVVQVHVEMADKSQSDIFLGLPGPLRSVPDYLDASLMNTILGVFGMMGRIGRSVREQQGLAYYAYSHLDGGLGPAAWYVSAGVAPNKVEQAVESVLAEIGRIQNEPVPLDEVADSQAYRTGSMPVGLETNSGLADVICDIELYDLGLDYLQKYPATIHGITAERIQAAARKYLSTEQLVVAVAGASSDGE